MLQEHYSRFWQILLSLAPLKERGYKTTNKWSERCNEFFSGCPKVSSHPYGTLFNNMSVQNVCVNLFMWMSVSNCHSLSSKISIFLRFKRLKPLSECPLRARNRWTGRYIILVITYDQLRCLEHSLLCKFCIKKCWAGNHAIFSEPDLWPFL